jgi:hypothetical protein
MAGLDRVKHGAFLEHLPQHFRRELILLTDERVLKRCGWVSRVVCSLVVSNLGIDITDLSL